MAEIPQLALQADLGQMWYYSFFIHFIFFSMSPDLELKHICVKISV